MTHSDCCCREEVAALKELLLEKIAARDKAVTLASTTLGQRLEEMNDFRNQLTAQAAKFITRLEHDTLLAEIGRLNQRVEVIAGRLVDRDEMERFVLKTDFATAVASGVRRDDNMSDFRARLSALESRLYLGGAGIVVLLTTLQLIFNYWLHR